MKSIATIQKEIIDEFSLFDDWMQRYEYMIELGKSLPLITKGIIALLLRVYSKQHPSDILQADTSFIDKIGLKEHLSPTRANGLLSMVKQLKMYAIAYQTQLN